MRLQDTQHEEISDRETLLEYKDPSAFDRLAFAARALEILRPKRMRVAVFPASRGLTVTRGREFAASDGASWAMVGIPPQASREHIAYALAELAGAASVPYAVQAILASAR